MKPRFNTWCFTINYLSVVVCLQEAVYAVSRDRNSILCSSMAESPRQCVRVIPPEITNWNTRYLPRRSSDSLSVRVPGQRHRLEMEPCPAEPSSLRVWAPGEGLSDQQVSRFKLGKHWKHGMWFLEEWSIKKCSFKLVLIPLLLLCKSVWIYISQSYPIF